MRLQEGLHAKPNFRHTYRADSYRTAETNDSWFHLPALPQPKGIGEISVATTRGQGEFFESWCPKRRPINRGRNNFLQTATKRSFVLAPSLKRFFR